MSIILVISRPRRDNARRWFLPTAFNRDAKERTENARPMILKSLARHLIPQERKSPKKNFRIFIAYTYTLLTLALLRQTIISSWRLGEAIKVKTQRRRRGTFQRRLRNPD